MTPRTEHNVTTEFPLWVAQAKAKLYLVIGNSTYFLLWDFKPAPAKSPRGGGGSLSPSGPFQQRAGWWPAQRRGWLLVVAEMGVVGGGCPADLTNAIISSLHLAVSHGLGEAFHSWNEHKTSWCG